MKSFPVGFTILMACLLGGLIAFIFWMDQVDKNQQEETRERQVECIEMDNDPYWCLENVR